MHQIVHSAPFAAPRLSPPWDCRHCAMRGWPRSRSRPRYARMAQCSTTRPGHPHSGLTRLSLSIACFTASSCRGCQGAFCMLIGPRCRHPWLKPVGHLQSSLAGQVLGRPSQVARHLVLAIRGDIAIGRVVHADKVTSWIDIDALTEIPVFP
jgi:hypothetical protein